MFPKRVLVIVGIICLIFMNAIFMNLSGRQKVHSNLISQIVLYIASPFQTAATNSIRFVRDIWVKYFDLVSVVQENQALKMELGIAIEKNNRCQEIEKSNQRLRKFLNFQQNISGSVIAAEVIAKDPSPWFKAIIIDKGKKDGVIKGLPVVVPQGIVGQVIEVTLNYSKVLLIIDRNSAVDGLVQRIRARGIIHGDSTDSATFQYALRKHDIKIGDNIISSGLDGVYPKGLRVGKVSGVLKQNSGIFQIVSVIPYVDFETIEEVLIISQTLQD